MDNFKNIHIGELIMKRANEINVSMSRICNFMNCIEKEVEEMYKCKTMDSGLLLRWSKLLEYDFFRIYTQHIILYAPPKSVNYINTEGKNNSTLPQFRKNIYTMEIISFILEMIKNGKKTKNQIVKEYNIPKTTLYKWIEKHN